MIPRDVEGLLVPSGKCVCVEPRGMLRGMSQCMTLGTAAGCASAVTSRLGLPVSETPVPDIQRRLLALGAYLGEPERLRELGL